MSDEELEQAIEDIVTNDVPYVHVNGVELSLDGTFTPQEIIEIAELLEKEGRV